MALGSMHHKELVMEPVLREAFDIEMVVPQAIDTDQLGTFTGEIERKNSPIECAKQKCLMAMENLGLDIGIATEGSFGQHPLVFFSQGHQEIVVLIDKKYDLVLTASVLTTNTIFSGRLIQSLDELREFCKQVEFPHQGLILKDKEEDFSILFKGISSEDKLEKLTSPFFKRQQPFWLETDMRAMFSPSRMKVIKEATKKMVDKMTSCCPECNVPGFSKVRGVEGLKCSHCGLPTKLFKEHEFQCVKCDYTLRSKNGVPEQADPTYCDFCNP